MKKLLPHAVLLLLCLLAFCACEKCEVCTFGDWTTVTPATCTQPGTETRTCAECEFVEEREIPQLAHDMVFVETKTAATCTEKGADLYKCKNCDHTEDRSVTALGHKYGEWSEKTAATCTATGTKERTCSVCGDTATQAIAATGHKYGTAVTVKNATCSAEGLKKSTCSACGDTKEQIVGKTAHNYSSATCTKPRTCKSCGTTSGSANGHSWKDATCTEAKKCTSCGVTEGTALGHNYSSGKCTRCGVQPSVTIQLPATPVELSYYGYGNKKYTSSKVVSITTSLDYVWYDGTVDYNIVFTGESTYNYEGAGQSSAMKISYKLYDSEDIVVSSGTAYTESVKIGEKYREEICITHLTPGETYKLVVLDTN